MSGFQIKALERTACECLRAQRLEADLAPVEAKSKPRCTQSADELASLKELFKAKVPDYHKQACIYPVYCLLSIMAAAHLAGAPRGQKDLAVFAKSLSQSQRAALGIRRRAGSKTYSSPDQSTFSRMMSKVNQPNLLAQIKNQIDPPPEKTLPFFLDHRNG